MSQGGYGGGGGQGGFGVRPQNFGAQPGGYARSGGNMYQPGMGTNDTQMVRPPGNPFQNWGQVGGNMSPGGYQHSWGGPQPPGGITNPYGGYMNPQPWLGQQITPGSTWDPPGQPQGNVQDPAQAAQAPAGPTTGGSMDPFLRAKMLQGQNPLMNRPMQSGPFTPRY